MDLTLRDWLELLRIDEPVDDLLAGGSTLTTARASVQTARQSWPSVSQDYIAVLDQLEPFFEKVGDVIDDQAELVDRFNSIMSEFGFGIAPLVDRLLTEEDIDEMIEQRQQLADEFSVMRRDIEDLQDQIQALMKDLDDLLGVMSEGDAFAADEAAVLADELQDLSDALEAEGCLP